MIQSIGASAPPARREKVYEGKAKILYATSDPDLLLQFFKDDATAFDGTKRATLEGKGGLNNRISAHLFAHLERAGVPTHFVALVGPQEMLVRRLHMIPLEVVVRNVIAGGLAKRMGLPEGAGLPFPLVEYYYKRDDLHDPLLTAGHVRAFALATDDEMASMEATALRVNALLSEIFAGVRLTLVDFKVEFGRAGIRLLLADEISPDGCRLWEQGTGERMDKDRFRRDLGRVVEAYEEVAARLLELSP